MSQWEMIKSAGLTPGVRYGLISHILSEEKHMCGQQPSILDAYKDKFNKRYLILLNNWPPGEKGDGG